VRGRGRPTTQTGDEATPNGHRQPCVADGGNLAFGGFALISRDEANDQRDEATRQRDQAIALGLAAQSTKLQGENPALALTLAVESSASLHTGWSNPGVRLGETEGDQTLDGVWEMLRAGVPAGRDNHSRAPPDLYFAGEDVVVHHHRSCECWPDLVIRASAELLTPHACPHGGFLDELLVAARSRDQWPGDRDHEAIGGVRCRRVTLISR
jgi:hypothetical protein